MEAVVNDTEHEMDKAKPWAIVIPWAVICGLITLCVIVGNFLVIYSFTKNRHLRTRGNSLVISLAVVDFLTGLLCVPLKVVLESTKDSHLRNDFDEAWITLDIMFGICSVLHLTVISLERYAAICWPFHHRTASRRSYSVSISLAWLFGILAMALIQISIILKWVSYAYVILLMLFFVVPLFIILTTYCAIWKAVRKSAIRKAERETNLAVHDDARKRQVRMTFTMAVVVGAFIVTWAPQFVNATVSTICEECDIYPLYLTVKAIQYLGSAANPVIYAIRMPEFKRTLSRKSRKSFTSNTLQTNLSLSSEKKSRSSSNCIPMRPTGSLQGSIKSNNNEAFKRNHSENHLAYGDEVPTGNTNHAFEQSVFDTRF